MPTFAYSWCIIDTLNCQKGLCDGTCLIIDTIDTHNMMEVFLEMIPLVGYTKQEIKKTKLFDHWCLNA